MENNDLLYLMGKKRIEFRVETRGMRSERWEILRKVGPNGA